MLEGIKKFFDTTMFSPHGFCLLWDPEVLIVHVVSDAIIALSYFSIPFALAIFVSKRSDIRFGWLFWAFAAFILACGLTHVLSIYTLWVPIYGIEGVVKAITALASIGTAILLWPLLPRLLRIPSPPPARHREPACDGRSAVGQSPLWGFGRKRDLSRWSGFRCSHASSRCDS
ncbi:hypothetical protein [Bradyrhizobium sp. BR13661]|jgi:hypothetical protein|uniref:hypothetical protein n=1 Tax=Bradyrhizobium sp. BR13661 TaxID=2940622 RepID=UPI0032AED2EE